MKYTPATFAKAIVGFVTAFGGAAATSAPHDAIGWVGCAGAGLVAFAAVFATPNKTGTEHADAAIEAMKETVQKAAASAADVERLRQVAGDVLGRVPVLGPVLNEAGKRAADRVLR